ncbi:MAG TPA: helix-turn-helix domain-containing protein [Patescibacteria group bacterium]|nr:helix-turn-helix domain-containing protein [Patescibacteria group bacterium]
MALLAPGPIPQFPATPVSQSGFQCEAYNDCRLGTVSWDEFGRITANDSESAFKHFHSNDMKLWYRLLLRSSSFLNLGLHERIAVALLELCSDFGIEESRGTLLRVTFSHKDIANLVGASRPRVTEHLARLEREAFLIRQGRQMVVRVSNLFGSINFQVAPGLGFAKSNERRPTTGPRETSSNRTSRQKERLGASHTGERTLGN